MPSKKRRIRMIMATMGLEPHWRGAVTVVDMLRGLGMEVTYMGNAFPEEILQAAIQKDVDVVGVSTLTGTHLTLGSELLQMARQKGIKDSIVFVIGGMLPPYDIPKLKELGFDGVFGPGASGEEIHHFITNAVTAKVSEAQRTSLT